MPNLIVSTCGTSILTNQTPEDLRKLLNKYSNVKKPTECPDNHCEMIEYHLTQRLTEILEASDSDLAKFSAEMNALLKFYGDNKKNQKQDMHILIHTDTWLGRETGNTLRAILEKQGFSVDTPTIADLRTENIQEFQLALSELAQWATTDIKAYKNKNYKIIFNLTGGFKSIQGFMQSLAMLYADESIYVFETGKELLSLPRLPIKLDAKEVVKANSEVLRALSLNLPYNKSLADLPETWLLKVDNDTTLSPWGEVIWQDYKDQIYANELLDPPTERIKFEPSFKESLKKIESDRYILLNQQIDKLATYLHSGFTKSLKSLDVKSLGTKYKGSTHEFDAWHDQKAMRVFGRLDGNTFICDRLDDGLGH
jgi:putative CRISPR-associated protein (TIGR02619 family)